MERGVQSGYDMVLAQPSLPLKTPAYLATIRFVTFSVLAQSFPMDNHWRADHVIFFTGLKSFPSEAESCVDSASLI